jgi:hypothetical protein
MAGNFAIDCGHCQHRHYRVVENGHVTAERHHEKYGGVEVIKVMPSACSKRPRKCPSKVMQMLSDSLAGAKEWVK